MISKGVFLAQMQVLMQAYNHGLPETSIETYYQFLTDAFDDEGFKRITGLIIRDNKRFPTIADFMEAQREAAPWYCRW